MKIDLTSKQFLQGSVIVVPSFEFKEPKGIFQSAIPHELFSGKSAQVVASPPSQGSSNKALIHLGLGAKQELSFHGIRDVFASLMKHPTLANPQHDTLTINLLPLADSVDWSARTGMTGACRTVTHEQAYWFGQAIAEGLLGASYLYQRYRSKEGGKLKRRFKRCSINLPPEVKEAFSQGLEFGQAVSLGVNLCRDLCNTPNADMKPGHLARATQQAAKPIKNLAVKVIERSELESMGAGGILAVNAASPKGDSAARLIIIEYSGAAPQQAPLCLVGKGVTVDKGGYCIKPDNPRAGFKMDMGGAATMIGATLAIAKARLSMNVVTLIPTTENLISDTGYLPGDVLNMLSGMTVENKNTDAEGRLILADALTYAQKHYAPDTIIDAATLTGAKMLSLGDLYYAVMTPNDQLAQELSQAADDAGERAWRLPLPNEYDSYLNSEIADVANIGGPYAGSITAGLFLKRFVDPKQCWAHLDIAGNPQKFGTKREAYEPEQGATGAVVRSLVTYARFRAGS